MKKDNLKTGDKVIITSFETLVKKGKIDIMNKPDGRSGITIYDNTSNIPAIVSLNELETWKSPKKIQGFGRFNEEDHIIDEEGKYYPVKWIRKRA